MLVAASGGASALRLVAQDLRAAVSRELTRQCVRAALSAPGSYAQGVSDAQLLRARALAVFISSFHPHLVKLGN
jgi:hypothetical protein